MQLATLLDDPNVNGDLIRAIANRVFTRRVKPDIIFGLSETYALRPLLGAAYYVYLVDLLESQPLKNGVTKLGRDQGCDNDDLRQRLLNGYWSLTQVYAYFWFDLPQSEGLRDDLNNAFLFRGLKPVLHPRTSADVLTLVGEIRRRGRGDQEERAEFDAIVQTFKDTIMDHFDL